MKGFTVAIFVAVLCAVSAAPSVEERVTELLSQDGNLIVVEKYKCAVNVFKIVSGEAGLENLWKEYENHFSKHIINWEECKNVDGQLQRILCNLKHGYAGLKLAREYTYKALQSDPIFLARFGQKFYNTCVSTEVVADELLAAGFGVPPTAEHLKCIVKAIREAVDKTPYAELWQQYEKVLKKQVEKIYSCKDKPTPGETRKCIIAEVHVFGEIVKEFYTKLHTINAATLEKIRKNIKDQCYKPSFFDVL